MCSGKYNITKKKACAKRSGEWTMVVSHQARDERPPLPHPFPINGSFCRKFFICCKSLGDVSVTRLAVPAVSCTCTKSACAQQHVLVTRDDYSSPKDPLLLLPSCKNKTTNKKKKKKERIVCTFRKSFCIHSVLAFVGDEWEICSH